jgi:hypothetical protein
MLLWLPKEILMAIYSLVLGYPVPIHFFKESTFPSRFHGPPDLALLSVSRCVREDALVAFARVNTFILNVANGVPRQWMDKGFLQRLTTAEVILPIYRGRVIHEAEALELLEYVRVYTTSGARMRFVIESRDGSVMRRSNPVLKILADMQKPGLLKKRRPLVSFEEYLELGRMNRGP